MKCYEFGEKEKPVIMLLPGTCCHWKNNFGHVIDLLTKDFYVVCVSYDGFDETEDTQFPGMIIETKRIEQYIRKKFRGKVHAIYGCSLGGSFVGLLAQRKYIHMNHGIIGSSDFDQAGKISGWIQTKIMCHYLYKIAILGQIPKWLKKRMIKSGGENYVDKALKMFGKDGVDLSFVTKTSIMNQYYSDLITPLDDCITVPRTKIHCFYAKKMGDKYLERYKSHFLDPHIVTSDLMHEELLLCKPREWVMNIKECVLENM